MVKKSKKETLRRISHSVFLLEEQCGHLKWKVTALVRKAKVSRSLVYEYLGSSKKEILVAALRNFLGDFYGFDDQKTGASFADQIMAARKRMLMHPEAVVFCQKWRRKDSWLTSEFVSTENRFQGLLRKDRPDLTEMQTLAIHTMVHGLVTAPFLSAEKAGAISRLFEDLEFRSSRAYKFLSP